jgi:Ca-activated chloride channel family protein
MRAAAVLFAAVVAWRPAFAEEPHPKVMLVLDASGSMWGHVLDDRPRIAVAREVVHELLEDWDSRTLLGLTVYGHRTKGDCQDIETPIPVGPLDKPAFLAAVDGISPKGKTPLSESVRRAAAELKYTEEKATVVLVSDGEETCNLDPCKVAEELEKQGVDFTAHVIGFSLVKQVQQDQLRCLAEKTGGRFFLAEDAAGLKDALRAAVRVAEGKSEEKKVEAPPPTAKPVAAKTGLKLVAVLAQGAKPLQDGMRWDILPESGDQSLRTTYEPSPFVELPPGRYRVRAKRGEAQREMAVELAAGEGRRVEVVLGAGRLKLVARLAADKPPVEDQLRWTVFESRVENEEDGRGAQVALTYDAQPVLTLPAGLYVVVAKRGDAEATSDVEVAAGDEKRYEVVIAAGRVKLVPKLSAAGQPITGNLAWQVLSPTEDIEGKRERVALSYEDAPVFTLARGKYRVHVKRGEATKDIDLETAPGKDQRIDVVLDAGIVEAVARLEAGGQPIGGVAWDVLGGEEDIEGKRERIATVYQDTPTLTLNAGRYRLVARKGSERAFTDIEVKAGDKATVELKLGGQ